MNDAKNGTFPNIVFIIADDQRYDTVGGINNPEIFTPNLTYLARNGTFFNNTYIMGSCHPAVCMASRAMLHTGNTLFHLNECGEHIPENKIMLGEHLQDSGYSTFGIGKWHNGESSFNRSFQNGSSIFFGGMDDHWNLPVCNYVHDGSYPEEVEISADTGYGTYTLQKRRFHKRSDGIHATELFGASAAKFILNYDRNQPFFLYAAFTSPHYPRTAKQKYHSLYDWEKITLNKNVRAQHGFDNGSMNVPDEYIESYPVNDNTWRKHIADYYAMISHMDFEIGTIIDALRAKGILDNTLIIYTSDHGLSIGGHGLMGKHNLYDHSLHIPLIFYGPKIPGNENRNTTVYLSDIYPTICEYLNIQVPESVEGKSFLKAFRDDDYKHRQDLFFAYKNCQRSVFDGRYKLIEYLVQNERKTQLFDLVEDIHEIRDLSADDNYSNLIRHLRNRILYWMKSINDDHKDIWEKKIFI